MWLLCPRRHVVGGPFPSPAVVSRRQLPFIQIQVSSLSLYAMLDNRDYPTDSVLTLTLLLQIRDPSYSVLSSRPSIPGIPAPRHLTAGDASSSPGRLSSVLPAPHQLTAANALSSPGRLSSEFQLLVTSQPLRRSLSLSFVLVASVSHSRHAPLLSVCQCILVFVSLFKPRRSPRYCTLVDNTFSFLHPRPRFSF